jgi:hypothetical protein
MTQLCHVYDFIPEAAEGEAMLTFTVTVTFTTDHDSDEHLRDEQAIRDEFQSWLENLKATVKSIEVTR